MAAIKVSIPMQKQILELHAKGFTARKIAKTLKVGRNTIKRVLLCGDVVTPGAIAVTSTPKKMKLATVVDFRRVHLRHPPN